MSVNSNQIQITQTVETSFEDINPHVETRDSQCNMTQNRKCFLTKILEGYQQRNAIDPLKTETSTEPYFHKSEELKKCEPRIRPKYVPLYSGPSLLEKLAGITRKNMAIEYPPPQLQITLSKKTTSKKRPAKNRLRYI